MPGGLLNLPDNRHRTVAIIGRLGGSDVSSSSIIEGMVDFLLETLDYDMLKRTVNFYFFPMANPDSVKYGNTLTNLTGSDLYSNWKDPHRVYQAEIFHIKQFLA
jgi:murein tripeptide amidase MpaA